MTDERTPPVALPRLNAAEAASFPGPACIIVVTSADEAASIGLLPPDRVAWVETTLGLVEHPALAAHRLDVVLTDPPQDAAHLYKVARVREGAPTRVTIPAVDGVGRAGLIALALNLPTRIVAKQPSSSAVSEMTDLLDRYLHDPQASAPMEPFHGALARLLGAESGTLWEVLEHDPGLFPSSDRALPALPAASAFVQTHVARLLEDGAECAACPLRAWCLGWFKWPDPTYACADIRRLFEHVEAAAMQLARDAAELDEAPPTDR